MTVTIAIYARTNISYSFIVLYHLFLIMMRGHHARLMTIIFFNTACSISYFFVFVLFHPSLNMMCRFLGHQARLIE